MKVVDTNILARFFIDDPDDEQACLQRPIATIILSADVTQRVVFAIGHMPFLRPSASTSFLMRND